MATRRGHGEGSIYRAGDRWIACIDLGWHNGRRVRKRVKSKTRKAASAALRRLQADAARGLAVVNDRRSVEEFLQQWLAEVVAPTTRPRTIGTYRSIVEQHLVPALGHIPLNRLRPAHVQRLVAAVVAAGKSPRTCEIIWSTLRRALKIAVRWGLVAVNPCDGVTPPRPRQREVTVLSVEEIQRLLALATHAHHGVAFVLALTTGMRRGEIAALKWSDIDLEAATLRVRANLQRIGGSLVEGEPKSERSRRTIRLSQVTFKALQAHRVRQAEARLRAGERWQDVGYVVSTDLGGPVDPRNLLRDWYALLDAAGIERRPLHVARHSAASLMLSRGVPLKTVQETLGHSTARLTIDLYGHLMPGDDHRAAEAMDAALAT